eukprot:2768467-Pyramimonas_sp.AAC.1
MHADEHSCCNYPRMHYKDTRGSPCDPADEQQERASERGQRIPEGPGPGQGAAVGPQPSASKSHRSRRNLSISSSVCLDVPGDAVQTDAIEKPGEPKTSPGAVIVPTSRALKTDAR